MDGDSAGFDVVGYGLLEELLSSLFEFFECFELFEDDDHDDADAEESLFDFFNNRTLLALTCFSM
jgi:hypothetical protein